MIDAAGIVDVIIDFRWGGSEESVRGIWVLLSFGGGSIFWLERELLRRGCVWALIAIAFTVRGLVGARPDRRFRRAIGCGGCRWRNGADGSRGDGNVCGDGVDRRLHGRGRDLRFWWWILLMILDAGH